MPDRVENKLGWYLDDWSEFELRLVIGREWIVSRKHPKGKWVGGPFSWKRARQIITIGGNSSIGLTTEAKQWARVAVDQLKQQWDWVFSAPLPKTIPLNAEIVSYLPTRRLTDASNLYQGPEDVMQGHRSTCKPKCKMHACVLEDDSAIESHNRSRRLYDKENPRVEIVLTRGEKGIE